MVTRAARILVTERAGARCEYCRAPQIITGTTYHIEHITPSTRGGSDDAANLDGEVFRAAYITEDGERGRWNYKWPPKQTHAE